MVNGIKEKIEDANKEVIDKVLASNPVLVDVKPAIDVVPGMKKKPTTSELIDWLKLLVSDDLAQEVLSSKQSNLIPPLYGALLKNEQDVELLQRLAFMSRRES